MHRNVFATGTIPVGNRVVRLADVRCRVLNLYGIHDALVPPTAHQDLKHLLPNAQFEELAVDTGHAGLFVGSRSRKAMTAMAEWFARGADTSPTTGSEA